MDDKELKEHLENVAPEERAAAWEEYVRNEVNALLDTFLPEAITGAVNVKYNYVNHGKDPKTGQQKLDKSKATGVFLSIAFEFAAPVEFFPEESE